MAKVNICLRIDEEDLEEVKARARQMAAINNRDFSHSDLIRQLIATFIEGTDHAS